MYELRQNITEFFKALTFRQWLFGLGIVVLLLLVINILLTNTTARDRVRQKFESQVTEGQEFYPVNDNSGSVADYNEDIGRIILHVVADDEDTIAQALEQLADSLGLDDNEVRQFVTVEIPAHLNESEYYTPRQTMDLTLEGGDTYTGDVPDR